MCSHLYNAREGLFVTLSSDAEISLILLATRHNQRKLFPRAQIFSRCRESGSALPSDCRSRVAGYYSLGA